MHPTLYKLFRPLWSGGFDLRKNQREVEETQWLSPEELAAYQLNKLKKLIKYAYENVPYYQNRYKSVDIHPDDIKKLEDVQSLPLLTKDDINNNLQEFVTHDRAYKLVSNTTGGSTGSPMKFYMERALGWWDPALQCRGRGWYGVREGEKVAFVWGAKRDMHDWNWQEKLKAAVRQERYLNAFNMTSQKIQAFAEMLVRWKPAMIRGYATSLELVAHYIKDHGINGIRPKLIETTAEKITIPQRNLFEEVFQCKVADWYTAREFGTVGYQCPQGSLHVCETRYLETIAHDQVVQPGEMGEVVVTSLHQYGMPFIRYKLNDLAIIEPDLCSCGRGLPRLREIIGRSQDTLVTSDGHYIYGGYFIFIFMKQPNIARYQVYQPDRNHLEIRLLCKDTPTTEWLAQIHQEVQSRFGKEMIISVHVVDDIPLTPAGKHRFIISDVKPEI